MKKTIIAAAFLIASFTQAQQIRLEVTMTGFKNNNGKVKVGLYNSEGTFLKTTFKGMLTSITSNQAKVVFEGLEKGEYAVSIYQDENENGVLDTNFMGIPKESYASSNNAKGFMGPPKYTDAKLLVKENSKITIVVND
jgi:uncharacterized protein (DUF2141 family)